MYIPGALQYYLGSVYRSRPNMSTPGLRQGSRFVPGNLDVHDGACEDFTKNFLWSRFVLEGRCGWDPGPANDTKAQCLLVLNDCLL